MIGQTKSLVHTAAKKKNDTYNCTSKSNTQECTLRDTENETRRRSDQKFM